MGSGTTSAASSLKTSQRRTITADIYTDWDIDQLAASLSEVLMEDED